MRHTLVRWEPFHDLVSIQDELHRLFGRTFSGAESLRPTAAGSWMPSMDVVENEDRFVATLELPGIEPEDVEVSVEDSTLTVRGSRAFSDEVKQENVRRLERRYGSFTRSISLPQSVDSDKVEAAFDKGILTIEVPKVEKVKPRKIKVKASGEAKVNA